MKLARSVVAVFLLFVLCMPFIVSAETYFVFSEEETQPIEIENPDFRNTKWGMTKEEVMAQEGGREIISVEEFSSDQKDSIDKSPSCIISYKDIIETIPASVMYAFDENGILMAANYLFDPQYSFVQYSFYIKNYTDIRDALIEKYGQLKDSDERWFNSSFKNSEKDTAFSVGALGFYAEWETETTSIALVLLNDATDHSVTFGIMYEDKNYIAPKKDNKL